MAAAAPKFLKAREHVSKIDNGMGRKMLQKWRAKVNGEGGRSEERRVGKECRL